MLKLRIFFCFVFLISGAVYAEEAGLKPGSEEEALFLRRIVEFWKDGEIKIARSQIEEYLSEHPDTEVRDELFALFGDLLLREEEYQAALTYYNKIEDEEIWNKILFNRLHAIYQLEWYATLIGECENLLMEYEEVDFEARSKVICILADSYYHRALASSDPLEKREYAKRAKPHFLTLLGTGFADQSQKPLADIYCILEEFEPAAGLYLALAEKEPENQEEFLFRAANLQIKFDEEKAIHTFETVCNMGGNHSKEAAYNRMILFFETKRYPEMILAKEDFLKKIPEDKIPLLHYFIARSHFILEDYPRAVRAFSSYIESEPPDSSELEFALISLIECARHLEDFVLYENSLEKLRVHFPKNRGIQQALFAKALLLKTKKKFKQAEEEFEKLRVEFPHFEDQENLTYEFAHLSYIMKDWDKARAKFRDFIGRYGGSTLSSLAWRFFINSSIQNASENKPHSKNQLVNDLEFIMKETGLLKEEERQEYVYLLARTNYEIEAYEEAIEILLPFLKEELSPSLTAASELLLGFSYQKGLGDRNRFCEHAERALVIDPEIPDRANVHLALYNAYVELEKTADVTYDPLPKAAEHLYLVQDQGKEIEISNSLWLAEFYYMRGKKFFENSWKGESPKTKIYLGRATEMLEKVLGWGESKDLVLDGSNLFLEIEVLKLADLYGIQKQPVKQIHLLEELKNQQLASSELKWNYQEQTVFDLAKAHHTFGNGEKALELYYQILTATPSFHNYISAASCLESARIRFALMEKDHLTKNDPELLKVLSQLKTLMIQKKFANEPVHLEAALDYIDIQCFLEEDQKEKKRLLLLARMKEEFESESDIPSKDYQSMRLQMPDKDLQYRSYINLIDAEMLICKSHLASTEGREDDARMCRAKAHDLLLSLTRSMNVTRYLYDRAKDNLANIEMPGEVKSTIEEEDS